jgi:hypothetical protein
MNAEADVEELGPVDWIVVEFPGSKFNGEIAPALADLVDRDLIAVVAHGVNRRTSRRDDRRDRRR